MRVFVRQLFVLCLLLVSASSGASPRALTVHFFDVGQGDAALILSPSGKSVLIDGGPPEAGARLARRVAQLVRGPLDLLILSHPHLDHLGGMTDVLRLTGARRYLDPGFDHPSAAYRDWLDEVGKRVGEVLTPEVDPKQPEELVTLGLGDGVSLSILWPRRPLQAFLSNTRSDANSNSIVARLHYGKTSFLFAGDAEPDTEALLVEAGRPLASTVLKVAHHGGSHSSTRAFLDAVRPEAAVISSGAGNDYGHPSPAALRRLARTGARILRTDLQGELVAVSDGATVRFETIASGGEDRYAGLPRSPVFHRARCPAVRNRRGLAAYPDRESALRERRPAKDCKP